MGAAGAVEAIFTILAVHNQAVPGVPTFRDPDPEINLNVPVRDGAARDPLRDLRQRRPRRPQRGGRVQALRGRLTTAVSEEPGGPQSGDRARTIAKAHPRSTLAPLVEGVPPVPPSQDPARRAVVTGLGAVMPNGNDFETYWASLKAGRSGVAAIASFDATGFEVRIAAEVKGFDPGIGMDPKMARRMSRFIHFAMAAGKEAVADAGLDFAAMTPEQRDRVGVVLNTGRRRHRADHRRDPHGRHARARASSARSRSRPCRARWPPACCRWSGGSRGPSWPRRPPARPRSSPSTTRCGSSSPARWTWS